MKILIIDDDRKLCRLIADYLEPMNYQVTAAHDGQEGLALLAAGDYQAVILDVMMPGADGFSVLQSLRRSSDVPVLMFSARDEEADRIVGLELGADDYLPKTFSSRELLARLRAVTRRARPAPETGEGNASRERLVVGPLVFTLEARELSLEGQPIHLTAVEYDLLVSLAQAAGRVLTRERLLDLVAGRDYDALDRSIDVHISSLRRKLGDDPRNPRLIQTIRSVGYMLKKSGGPA
nr:response regulator transcription factor [uncultured Holophaga sp.]